MVTPPVISQPKAAGITAPAARSVAASSPPVVIRMRGGYEIDVESGFDPELLGEVLRVVSRVCC